MTVSEAVLKRINKLLKQKNMTFYRLEIKSGILHGTLSAIRYGTSKNITLKTIMQLAKGFEITLLEFLDDPIFDIENFNLE
ncbi:MAG: helix-turn-helix transcriptional regulator [Clostridia bacterium]|nr:helix-turn-helix transcriptional regulator [Clostridia bacterium]